MYVAFTIIDIIGKGYRKNENTAFIPQLPTKNLAHGSMIARAFQTKSTLPQPLVNSLSLEMSHLNSYCLIFLKQHKIITEYLTRKSRLISFI